MENRNILRVAIILFVLRTIDVAKILYGKEIQAGTIRFVERDTRMMVGASSYRKNQPLSTYCKKLRFSLLELEFYEGDKQGNYDALIRYSSDVSTFFFAES